MSTLSPSQTEKTTQHPLNAVIIELNGLLEKLRLEIDVAPADSKAHQDLLDRIIKASQQGLLIPMETSSHSFSSTEDKQAPTSEDVELWESVETITDGQIGQEINVDAINKRLEERGYKIQLSFESSSES
ncbi:MAG TPA: hypothetical protein V6D15_14295 [Oculatellaceae cyanobacterium]|jgi:hypothetical protein